MFTDTDFRRMPPKIRSAVECARRCAVSAGVLFFGTVDAYDMWRGGYSRS
jgi:hypothetical protein